MSGAMQPSLESALLYLEEQPGKLHLLQDSQNALPHPLKSHLQGTIITLCQVKHL